MNQKCTHNHESELTQVDIKDNSSIKWVAIREDSLKTIREIADKLTDKNILHEINLSPGCKNGSCALKYILIVPEDQVKNGLLVIDDYFISLHPEFKKSKELEEQGKCPACGFDNGHNVKTCADCGLQLIIEY
ncbi:MAG: hypothetical protein OEZ13_04470 [Spirochaetia bacterium]|nr:hypothetical protein [Spirochaetia bacterium]